MYLGMVITVSLDKETTRSGNSARILVHFHFHYYCLFQWSSCEGTSTRYCHPSGLWRQPHHCPPQQWPGLLLWKVPGGTAGESEGGWR